MNMKRSILLPLLLAFSGAALAQPAELSTPIRGITLESTDNLDMTLKLIKSSRKRLTVRLVMDGNNISAYKEVVDALAPHANIMVQILDSEQMPKYSVEKIRKRTTQAMNAFGDKVALWEIGNELNGDWVGSSPQEINAKAQAAYEVVKKRNGKTALTLNYWAGDHCYAPEKGEWQDTLSYAKGLPASLRNVDYALLSIYETACKPAQHPSSADLAIIFNEFQKEFSNNTKFGIGEIGTQDESDEQKPATLEEKKRIANYYYGLQQPLYAKMKNRYVGGYFWWYFHRDATLPEVNGGRKDNLWPTLKGLLEQL
jgi:hypothetical protein